MDHMEQPEPEVPGHYYALQVSGRGRISSGGVLGGVFLTRDCGFCLRGGRWAPTS